MLDEQFTLWLNTIEGLSNKAAALDGDFVECGVYIGTSAGTIAQNCNKTFHLFDSWEGVSILGEFDNDLYETLVWKTDIELARINLSRFGNLKFYKGWIPDRFEEVADIKIAFLHIDASLYQPTKDSLEFMWDRMVPGGYVVCNTHEGLSTGPEKAVREFFADKAELIQYPMGILVAIK
jgi:hypothetical protein